MLKDITAMKSELIDEMFTNFIEIAELLIYYKRVIFSIYSYTSLLHLIYIIKSLYYSVKNLKDVADYENS